MMDELGTVYVTEVMRRIRSRPYIIGLLVVVIAIALLTRLPTMLEGAFNGARSIVLVGDQALVARAKPLLSDDYKVVGTLANGPVDDAVLKRYRAGSAIELRPQSDGLHVTVYAHDPGGIHRDELSEALLPLQL
jgi:hypothetical protein